MSNTYTSSYPTIIIDKRSNSVNESLQKKITIEEYYDLMHHTHKMSSIINDIDSEDGTGTSFSEMQKTINELLTTVNELKTTIATQQNTIDELKETIQSIETSEGVTVSDWDVNTPGNQDVDGNDLGTLMGLTMTEIE